ncbi:TM2 domain-containing protein [Paenibacillaceae bacterium]|nr:TM2 domain-containing protein [Paenibacillaceae bacterium]
MSYHIAQKSQLETRELLLLEQEVKNHGKNMVVAYILWYFLGLFGAHNFYMQRNGVAVAQLVLTITIIGLFVNVIWLIVDAFLLHQWVKDHNQHLEARIIDQMLSNRHFETAMNRPY